MKDEIVKNHDSGDALHPLVHEVVSGGIPHLVDHGIVGLGGRPDEEIADRKRGSLRIRAPLVWS